MEVSEKQANKIKVNLPPPLEVQLDDAFRLAGLSYTQEEVEAMTFKMQEDGQLDEQMVGWKEQHTLLWNYTKYDIAVDHGLKPEIRWISLGTQADALAWIADKILAIPNITLFSKIEHAKPFGEYWQEKYDRKHPICKAALQRFKTLDSLGIIAVKAGTSRVTVNKVDRILDHNEPEMIQQCQSGELSISTAYDLLPANDHANPQTEPDDKKVGKSEAKSKTAKKAKEVQALVKYSVKGFYNHEKLDEHGRKFFILRWNEEHPKNKIEIQEVREAIDNYEN